MDLSAMDMNLLVVLDALLEHRNVTRAGGAVGLSQPAMSAALARLRRLFNDPLFVRSGAQMKPTSRALELTVPVRQVMNTVRTEILQCSSFDPATSDRRFALLTSDHVEMLYVPSLLAQLVEVAPNVRLATLARAPQAAAEALESGIADLALGYFPDLHKSGFVQQKLFDDSVVCLVRRGYPCVGSRLTIEAYQTAEHVVVRPDGREHVFDQFVQRRRLCPRVVLELSHFLSLLPVLESSDLIATLPRDQAELCKRYADLRILELPPGAPSRPIHQMWHERVHKDPANTWLRGIIHELLTGARLRAATA